MPARDLHWPAELHPATAPVFTHNEIYIPADADRVWAQLVRAAHWPERFAQCADLRFEDDDDGPDLGAQAEFSWRSFGSRITATVSEFEPPYRLAWYSSTKGTHAYHGWVIDPVDDGCRVITQVSQSGFLPSVGRLLFRRLLRRSNHRWLLRLAEAIGEADRELIES